MELVCRLKEEHLPILGCCWTLLEHPGWNTGHAVTLQDDTIHIPVQSRTRKIVNKPLEGSLTVVRQDDGSKYVLKKSNFQSLLVTLLFLDLFQAD